MKLHFLPLNKSDLDQVEKIERCSFAQPWTRDMFEREIALAISHFYVACFGKDIAGYGGYWKITNESHITNIAVRPDLRFKGLGKEILAFLIKKMHGQNIKRVFLEVRQSNSAAQKLYKSAGFEITGLRLKYYGCEDAVLMERRLREIV